MLKGRWKSLCGLRLKVDTDEYYEYAIQQIIIYIVLHNILLDVQDSWIENEGQQIPKVNTEYKSDFKGIYNKQKQ